MNAITVENTRIGWGDSGKFNLFYFPNVNRKDLIVPLQYLEGIMYNSFIVRLENYSKTDIQSWCVSNSSIGVIKCSGQEDARNQSISYLEKNGAFNEK